MLFWSITHGALSLLHMISTLCIAETIQNFISASLFSAAKTEKSGGRKHLNIQKKLWQDFQKTLLLTQFRLVSLKVGRVSARTSQFLLKNGLLSVLHFYFDIILSKCSQLSENSWIYRNTDLLHLKDNEIQLRVPDYLQN